MELTEFDATVASFHISFDHLTNWMSWWLRPSIASMIFPSKRAMTEELAAQLPNTSNPVETQHSLLHHGAGKNHEPVSGMKAIHLQVEGLRREYEAIMSMWIIQYNYAVLYAYLLVLILRWRV